MTTTEFEKKKICQRRPFKSLTLLFEKDSEKIEKIIELENIE
jgi:hypothetical protein